MCWRSGSTQSRPARCPIGCGGSTACLDHRLSVGWVCDLIPLFVTNLLDERTVPLYGDGGNVREWLHIDDHVQGIELVRTGGRPGETYNIGGGAELTNWELTELLLQACGREWDDSVTYVQDRRGHDRRYSVDCAKIRDELGYRPRVSFADGLADTVNWYRGNRDWWEPLKATVR
jgi:dTDP-glucose 4,6-dehydratase